MSRNDGGADDVGATGDAIVGGSGGPRRSEGAGEAVGESASTAASVFQTVLALAGVVLVVTFVGFALWQAATAPRTATPEVAIVDSRAGEDGSVIVTVALRNPNGVGLDAATISIDCTSPPTTITFENVPAGAERTARIRCPPGTTDPAVTLSSWRTP